MLKQRYRHLPKFSIGIHFVTKNLHRRKPLFFNHDLAFIQIEEFSFYRKYYDFKIFAYVIMPEHFHILLWWDYEQKPDVTISKIIQSINSVTAKRIIKYFQTPFQHQGSREHVLTTTPNKELIAATLVPFRMNPNKKSGSEHTKPKYKIWQTGAYDFNIITERKLEEKINYIHQNPYLDPKINNPETYPFSSERFYLYDEEGLLKIDSLEDL